MFSLYRKKTLSFILFFFIVVFSFGQSKIKYQPDYDAKRIRFGYFLGLANTNYVIRHNPAFISTTNNSVYAITSPTSTGIKAGGLINFYINEYFDFRIAPLSVSIYARKLLENDSIAHNQVDKAWFEIPLHFKFKSERRNNSRMFVFAGLKYGFETNVVNKRNGQAAFNSFTTKTSDFSIEYGMGLELFREYFKVTPELHFSHGIRNMINPGVGGFDPNNFLSYIDRMNTHSVTFFIVFQ
jgi:hypothetical protein